MDSNTMNYLARKAIEIVYNYSNKNLYVRRDLYEK